MSTACVLGGKSACSTRQSRAVCAELRSAAGEICTGQPHFVVMLALAPECPKRFLTPFLGPGDYNSASLSSSPPGPKTSTLIPFSSESSAASRNRSP
jgi:hypothetical protein